jgi:hypothetical protein
MKIAVALLLCFVTTNPANKPDGKAGKHSATAEDKTNPTVTFVDNHTPTPEDKRPEQKPPDWYTTSAPAEWALVGVGIAGVIAAIRSLRAINSQISEMRKQVEVATLQVRAMQEQITEMSKQTDALERSVDIAKQSADAARDNVNLVINKERARIRIGPVERLILTVGVPLKVEFRLLYYGSTPAFHVTSEVWTVLSESLESYEKITIPHGITDLPGIASTENFTTGFDDFLLKPLPLDQATVDRIIKGEMHVHFQAIIKYIDFFDKSRETAFHYRWHAADTSRKPRGLRWEFWDEVGGEKDNYYT